MTVIQNLEKNIEYIRMSFFDFIKQNNRVRILSDLLAQLSALLISHISGRRTDHLGYTVLLHIF